MRFIFEYRAKFFFSLYAIIITVLPTLTGYFFLHSLFISIYFATNTQNNAKPVGNSFSVSQKTIKLYFCTKLRQMLTALKNSFTDRRALDSALFIALYCIVLYSLQCFDTVGWAAGRASGL